MNISLSDVSLETYKQLVSASLQIIKKAKTHFKHDDVFLNDLVQMRLIDDMAPLSFQVYSIVHHSVGAIEGLLNGKFSPPKVPHNLNFDDLIKLLEKAEKDLNKFSEDQINSCSKKDIIFKMGQIEWVFSAEDFILSFSLPNFYFHATTMYDMFRIKGLQIGKLDFTGQFRKKN